MARSGTFSRFSWRGLVPYLAYAYLTFVGWTTRTAVKGEERRGILRRGNRRFIYAFWHQRQAFLTWTHRHDSTSVLVSRSRDGEMIADVMRLSGIHAARGSSSRGAVAGLLELQAAAASGLDLGITPDGPRGPAREVKPGVLFLAQKLELPILPLTNALSRKLEFKKSWDRFQVPLPFGRASVRYGEPLYVRAGDDLAKKAAELKSVLDQLTEQAERDLDS